MSLVVGDDALAADVNLVNLAEELSFLLWVFQADFFLIQFFQLFFLVKLVLMLFRIQVVQDCKVFNLLLYIRREVGPASWAGQNV